MINEKKEQMIRETFDQCLSGIDSLPSELPAIERKLKKAKTPDREPIRFRVPAIAAVLVILLCFGFFARGKWGMINQPDRIRSEDGYTTQPVQTALAQGTEQDAGTVTVQPEPVQTILAEGTEPAAGTVIVQPEFELNDGTQFFLKESGGLEARKDGLVYTLKDDKTAILTGVYWDMEKGIPTEVEFNVPEKVGGYKVVALTDGALGMGGGPRAVVRLPETMKTIGFYAFRNNDRLTGIELPRSLRIIEWNAFMECTGLTSVDLPDGLEIIMDGAFNGCKGLKSIAIPDSVTELGAGAFSSCTSLEEIVLSSGITEIGEGMFNSCTSLKRLDIPQGVTTIGNRAFRNCTSLEEVSLPDNLVSLGAGAFNGCAGLKAIVIPEKVTVLENGTFNGCENLEAVVLPDGLTKIGSRVFYNCGSLSVISLPDSLTSIGREAFSGCDKLVCVVSDGSAAMQYCEENGIKYTKR